MTRRRTLRIALVLAIPGALPIGSPAAAQLAEDTFDLPEIVVTATRMPHRRDAIPVSVTVITGDELERRGVETVAEALRAVPSAAVVSAGPAGAQTALFMRGGESDYVKVLVDGVPLNEPGGSIDLADLSVTNVERIEIVRGPTSVLYGSDAVTGVVQVFTRHGRGASSVTATALAGRGDRRNGDGYSMLDLAASLSGGDDRLSYSLGLSRTTNGGLLPLNNGYRNRVASARVAAAPVPGMAIAVSARLHDARYHYPTDGAGRVVDANAVQDGDGLTFALDFGQRIGPRATLRLLLAANDASRTFDDAPDGPADTVGTFAGSGDRRVKRQSADARLDVALSGASVLSVGATVERGAVQGSSEYVSQYGPFPGETDARRSTVGTYAQLVAQPLHGAALQAGVRREDAETFGTFDTWRLGASYELPLAVRLRASYGTAFREPTLAESFGSGFGDVGNPDLEPERTRSWEVGLERALGGGSVAVTWFDQDFTDLVQYTFAPPEPGAPNYYNVGGAVARGLEVEAAIPLSGALALEAGATVLETRVTDPGLVTDQTFVEGETLLRRAAFAAETGMLYRFDTGSIHVVARHTGRRDDVDYSAGFPAPRITLDAVTVVDLAAEYAPPMLGGQASILLRLDNATGAEYQQIAGFPAPGRVVRLGLRLSY